MRSHLKISSSSFEVREFGEREISVTVIGEYERLAWGDGGEDFDWYCTSNTEAHVGKEPVYISNKTELQALMGKDAYAVLAKLCDQRIAGIKDAQKRSLPLFVIQHPATIATRSAGRANPFAADATERARARSAAGSDIFIPRSCWCTHSHL